jgi:hypothetical protein
LVFMRPSQTLGSSLAPILELLHQAKRPKDPH